MEEGLPHRPVESCPQAWRACRIGACRALALPHSALRLRIECQTGKMDPSSGRVGLEPVREQRQNVPLSD